MKLKVQGTECIYGCYVHSAVLPTFHRRCYWLLQNPDIVLVHYLNVPFTDDNKIISPTLNYFADSKKEWTKEELISELKPMCELRQLAYVSSSLIYFLLTFPITPSHRRAAILFSSLSFFLTSSRFHAVHLPLLFLLPLYF